MDTVSFLSREEAGIKGWWSCHCETKDVTIVRIVVESRF